MTLGVTALPLFSRVCPFMRAVRPISSSPAALRAGSSSFRSDQQTHLSAIVTRHAEVTGRSHL